MAAVSSWALITTWSAIYSGHPSYLIFYGATLAVAAASVYRSVRRSSKRRAVSSVLASLALLFLAAASFWLRPFTAESAAVNALANPEQYVVTTMSTEILLEPTQDSSSVGLIFQPGARVDARAYASILADVAAGGHPVIIVKQPLGIGFLALSSIPRIVRENPEVAWVAAGHSLGGVAASQAVDVDIAGLVLWASFPAGDISSETAHDIISIYGTADGIVTVADITQSKDALPTGTLFLPVEGAIHSFFGDYGLQPGDGAPTIERAAAQAIIVAATTEFLDRVETRSGKSSP